MGIVKSDLGSYEKKKKFKKSGKVLKKPQVSNAEVNLPSLSSHLTLPNNSRRKFKRN